MKCPQYISGHMTLSDCILLTLWLCMVSIFKQVITSHIESISEVLRRKYNCANKDEFVAIRLIGLLIVWLDVLPCWCLGQYMAMICMIKSHCQSLCSHYILMSPAIICVTCICWHHGLISLHLTQPIYRNYVICSSGPRRWYECVAWHWLITGACCVSLFYLSRKACEILSSSV